MSLEHGRGSIKDSNGGQRVTRGHAKDFTGRFGGFGFPRGLNIDVKSNLLVMLVFNNKINHPIERVWSMSNYCRFLIFKIFPVVQKKQQWKIQLQKYASIVAGEGIHGVLLAQS